TCALPIYRGGLLALRRRDDRREALAAGAEPRRERLGFREPRPEPVALRRHACVRVRERALAPGQGADAHLRLLERHASRVETARELVRLEGPRVERAAPFGDHD